MDRRAALEAFDRQIRRSLAPPLPGWVVERTGPVVRTTADRDLGWGNMVSWSDLDEAGADAAIAEQVAHFGALGRGFEWKHYGYDRPPDLPERLRRAGLVPEAEETLVVGEAAEVAAATAGTTVPDGLAVREATPEDGRAIAVLHDAVWGPRDSAEAERSHPPRPDPEGAEAPEAAPDPEAARDEEGQGDGGNVYGDSVVADIFAEREADPSSITIHVVDAGHELVSAGWVRFHAGTDFASLWGGNTLPAWRRRGVYRRLVALRAEEAVRRGYRYLQVDCSPDSRPILERLGMTALTTTTPYLWTPPA